MKFGAYLWFYLWVVPHVLLVAVAIVMYLRGLHKDFPIFFFYTLYEFGQFSVLFTLYLLKAPAPAHLWIYFKADQFLRAGSIALRFGILQELFESPVAHSTTIRRAIAPFLNGATALLVVLALAFIGALDYSIFGYAGLKPLFTIEALNTAQCGLLAMVFLWHGFLGLRMSSLTFGIVIGMGLVVGAEPLSRALRDIVGGQDRRTVDIIQMATFHLAVLVWLYFALVREKATAASDPTAILNGRRWAADLGRVVQL
jgi:hypothetical protein